MHVYACACVYVPASVFPKNYACVYVCLCMSVYVYVCMYMCVSVCTDISVRMKWTCGSNRYFARQFELAAETGLPMFLHNRNTGGDFACAPQCPFLSHTCTLTHSYMHAQRETHSHPRKHARTGMPVPSSSPPAQSVTDPRYLCSVCVRVSVWSAMVRAHRGHFRDGVVHSFTGTWAECEELLSLGLYIGINGW
jgi:Tat protein secretion system quality control protein TatD with DNase activity